MLRWLMTVSLSLACAGMHVTTAYASGGLKVVVILDNSGSMKERMPEGGTKIDAAKQSLLKVLDQTARDAEVGVLLLNPNRRGQWLIPLGPIDGESMRAAVTSIFANGPTPLGASMKLATDALLETRDTQRYGTYKLLVVSDGEATDGDLVERYLPEIQARGVLIDVIGVAMRQQHSLAKRANTYRRADDPESLEEAISAVVLGESTSDGGGDAGESEFELLAPLPSEVATASLAALTTRRNRPIGESDDFDTSAQSIPDGHIGQPPAGVNQPDAAEPRGGAGGGRGFPRGYLIFGAILMIVLIKLISSIGKSR